MIVVSDTTPLISLLKIRRLDLLESLFGAVHIPQGVFDELTANPDFAEEASEIQECEFIRIQDVNPQEVSLFRRTTGLDLGESEALVLTDRLKADLLLVDEIRARHVAKSIGFNIMGTIGIFSAAYKEGSLSADEIREAVEILRSSGRHIGERLFKKLLESL